MPQSALIVFARVTAQGLVSGFSAFQGLPTVIARFLRREFLLAKLARYCGQDWRRLELTSARPTAGPQWPSGWLQAGHAQQSAPQRHAPTPKHGLISHRSSPQAPITALSLTPVIALSHRELLIVLLIDLVIRIRAWFWLGLHGRATAGTPCWQRASSTRLLSKPLPPQDSTSAAPLHCLLTV